MGDDLGLLVVQYGSAEWFNNLYYSTFAIKASDGPAWLELASYEKSRRSLDASNVAPITGGSTICVVGAPPGDKPNYCIIRLLALCLEYIVPVDEEDLDSRRKLNANLINTIEPDRKDSILKYFEPKYLDIYEQIAGFLSSELSNKLKFIFLGRPSLDPDELDIKSLEAFGFKSLFVKV